MDYSSLISVGSRLIMLRSISSSFYGFYHYSYCNITLGPYTWTRSQLCYTKTELKYNHHIKELKWFCKLKDLIFFIIYRYIPQRR